MSVAVELQVGLVREVIPAHPYKVRVIATARRLLSIPLFYLGCSERHYNVL